MTTSRVRYRMESFGCRTSQADGDTIGAQMEALGAIPVERVDAADVVVVNTCTVTAEADRDARAFLRRVRRENPGCRIVVTGCYAQRAPMEVSALPGVDAVVGNSHKDQVARVALAARPGDGIADHRPAGGFVPLTAVERSQPVVMSTPYITPGAAFAHSEFHLPGLPETQNDSAGEEGRPARRTRPALKIQDGCGNRCTFCVIPAVRGNSRSMAREAVLQAVRGFAADGGQEMVLSGINLGRWGRDLTPAMRLEELLEEIFRATALPRLRISSVEPMDWTDGLIGLFRRWSGGMHPRLARHAHLPLQSGSDGVLRRMHRRYRPWHYAERVAAVREACADAAIGADVMVGFPGETDAEFQETYDFIAAQPLTYLHLFPFSARPGTPGWELHRQSPVPGTAVRERMAALRRLIEEKNLAFRRRFAGAKLSAVTLVSAGGAAEGTGAGCTAMSDNFLPVALDQPLPPNRLVQVQVRGTSVNGLTGSVVRPDCTAA